MQLEKLIEQRIKVILEHRKIRLHEDRLTSDFAEYNIKSDRINILMKAQKASAFTKFAKLWKDLDVKVKDLEDKKRVLNDLKNDIESTSIEVKSLIKDELINVVDETERAMTIAVECAGSTFTLSKETEDNKDKVIPANTIVAPDYAKAWAEFEKIMEGNTGMIELMNTCITKTSNVINIAEQIIKGKERAVRIKVKENILTELTWKDAWVHISGFLKKLTNKIQGLLSINKTEVNKFSSLVNNLK